MALSHIPPALACKDLVRYLGKGEGKIKVLKSVSLEIRPGAVYSIVGPSGCGKSTLLYLLGLLDKPDAGQVFVEDIDVTQMNEDQTTRLRNRYLGFVFQFHFLLSEFTALENVVLPMRKANLWSEKEMKDRAEFLLTEVGLGDKTHRKANQLSGGEQQRVAVARSLANSPRVVLADEPTGNLDTENSNRVFNLMTRVAHEENISLLVVTHNPVIANACDIILEMKDGKILSQQALTSN